MNDEYSKHLRAIYEAIEQYHAAKVGINYVMLVIELEQAKIQQKRGLK